MGEDDFLPPLIEVLESEGTFGHRQHLCLAWRYLRTADEATAERLMRAAIRHVAALHGTPDRYHETLTIAWTRLVAAHVRADGLASFEEFIAENRELL
ncbi:MAG TPA: hypothetical protein VEH29_13300, partial [Acidimicrobiales bacterium]|nr:hypothetical protein [Acidimicrobiales bacterium]